MMHGPPPHHQHHPPPLIAPPPSRYDDLSPGGGLHRPYSYAQHPHSGSKTVLRKKFSWKHYPEVRRRWVVSFPKILSCFFFASLFACPLAEARLIISFLFAGSFFSWRAS
jgi:hypothetical protein